MKLNSVLIFCLFYSLLSFSSHSQSDTINIAVAANFKQTLESIKPQFEKNSTHKINIITASTGQLVQQIMQGAPFDILLAANTAHPQTLWQQIHLKNKLNPDALVVYALGRLVFFSHTKLDTSESLKDILTVPHFTKLSVANARLAPYGLAAKQTLEHLGLYEHWQPNLIIGQNIAQAFQFIHSKNVNAGFVAMSQVLDEPINQIRVVNKDYYKPIKQSALRINNKPSSFEFMDFLQSPPIKAIIEQHGYLLPK